MNKQEERDVLTMAQEGTLADFDSLLKLFDVIEEEVNNGKQVVRHLADKVRERRAQERMRDV